MNLWTRFREWLKRDTNLTVHIWNPRKGFIEEKDLKDVSIQGKIYSEDAQPSRKVMRTSQSFVLSVNPSFVRALCPFQEKRVTEQLVKDNSGKFLVIIEGVDPHSPEDLRYVPSLQSLCDPTIHVRISKIAVEKARIKSIISFAPT